MSPTHGYSPEYLWGGVLFRTISLCHVNCSACEFNDRVANCCLYANCCHAAKLPTVSSVLHIFTWKIEDGVSMNYSSVCNCIAYLVSAGEMRQVVYSKSKHG